MKNSKKLFGILTVVLATVLSAVLLISCDGEQSGSGDGEDTDTVGGVADTFFIDWQDGDFKKEYSLFSIPGDEDDWYKTLPVERCGYTFKGVYSEKNGQGERIFDTVGNKLADPRRGRTYYAHWVVNNVSVSFRFSYSEGSSYFFADGSKRICKLYSADAPIDFTFPEIAGGRTVSYWKSNDTRISDGSSMYGQYKTIADLMVDGDTDYINIYPVFETSDQTVTLTLDYGSRVESYDLTEGDAIRSYLVTYTQGNRELVGWTADRYDDENLIVNPSPIREDMTLYAVWREFTEVTLYGVDENYFDGGYVVPAEESRDTNPFCYKRIYEYRPEYLATPEREGYVFAGWYASRDFSGQPISRLISCEVNSGKYYARWVRKECTVDVRYNTGEGTKTFTVKFTVDETMRLKADLSVLPAPDGMRVICLLKSGVPCTDENGYWIAGSEPSPNYNAYYGAEVG